MRTACNRAEAEGAETNRRSRHLALAGLVPLALVLAACGGSKSKPPAPSTSAPRDRWGTVWLCRPGEAGNACTSSLTATIVTAKGATHLVQGSPAQSPPVDCFYVYPTISAEPTVNADLAIGLRERLIANAQASRFSQDCSVYAPVYRQITLNALAHPTRITVAHALVAYRSVVRAFDDYLAHYNRGRGIVFIGHSQGAAILIRLLQEEVDRKPAVRSRLVSALLLGGNVTTGDFAHIPACSSRRQTGCVVAYSSFTSKPPANSEFGRTTSNAGVNLLTPRNPSSRRHVLCVNPAAPGGGLAPLDPYIPSFVLGFLPAGTGPSVKTPWVAFPGRYTARCETSGDATWLQIGRVAGSPDRGLLTRLQDPGLGLHILDVNLALGNLVGLVHDEAAAYRRRPTSR